MTSLDICVGTMAGLYFSFFAENYHEKLDRKVQNGYWYLFRAFGFEDSKENSRKIENEPLLDKDSGTELADL